MKFSGVKCHREVVRIKGNACVAAMPMSQEPEKNSKLNPNP